MNEYLSWSFYSIFVPSKRVLTLNWFFPTCHPHASFEFILYNLKLTSTKEEGKENAIKKYY